MKRDKLGRFAKGSSNPWNKGMKGYTNSGSFISGKVKGENNPFYGMRHSEESKRKMSINNGMENSLEARKKLSNALKGRKLPEATKEKIKIAMRKRVESGMHNFWKGGISKYYEKINHSLRNSEWRNWRNAVFERDNYTCQKCGIKSGNGKTVFLHPHHIFPVVKCVRENKIDLIYKVENGITLCKKCHKIVHRYVYNKIGEQPKWI